MGADGGQALVESLRRNKSLLALHVRGVSLLCVCGALDDEDMFKHEHVHRLISACEGHIRPVQGVDLFTCLLFCLFIC